VAVFAVGILTGGDEVQVGWLKYYAVAVLAVTVAYSAWENFLWRTVIAQRIPGVPRSVRGTWRGTLTSLWEDSATGRAPDPKTVYLVVRQSASSAHVTLFSDETTSRSSLAKLTETGGGASLDYLYLDIPRPALRRRSSIHHGSGSLQVVGRPARSMNGCYWTDRESKGEVQFTVRCRGLAEDYPSASALFDQ
jgi:hypothetical protein